jgi:hypothetical protein
MPAKIELPILIISIFILLFVILIYTKLNKKEGFTQDLTTCQQYCYANNTDDAWDTAECLLKC